MKYCWLIVLAILPTGCMLDPLDNEKLPIWTTAVEVPLLHTEINLDLFKEDSLISKYPTGENGDSIYVFNKSVEFERVAVGAKLRMDPIENSFVQYASEVTIDSSITTFSIGYDTVGLDDITKVNSTRIGLIRLDNIDPEETDSILFSEIMPDTLVTSIRNIITASGDSADVVIDTVALVPQQKTLAFTSFRSAVVSSGFLDVTIINDLFIPLGAPIYIDVKTSIGVLIFGLIWDTEILPGDSATQTQILADTTLPGDLLIVVSGTSNGSRGDTVTVTDSDLSSTFRVRLETRDVQASQADAIVPPQTVIDSSTITPDSSGTVIEEAVLLTGALDVTITNNLPLTGTVQLEIPSLFFQTPDAIFIRTFDLLEGSFFAPHYNLAGYTMVMELDDQHLDYNYLIRTDATDPDYVVLDQADSVEMVLDVTNITFNEITGRIEQQTNIDSGEISLESDSQILTASISVGQMDIEILNRFGGVSDVRFTVDSLRHEGSPLDTVLVIYPGTTTHSISLVGYEIFPVSLEDQRLTYDTETVSRPGISNYLLLDSTEVKINISELTFDAITGYIRQENNIDEDQIDLDSETKVETALIDSGRMELTIRNFIGLEADVLFEVAELVKGNSSLAFSFPVTASAQPVLQTIDLSGYSLSLPLDDQHVHYTSTLTINSDSLLSLTLEDSITVDVLIDTMWFVSITGIIDTVEVEIDTVEREISVLPDEMDGFDLANVEMTIDFDSDLTIPVFLELAMETGNTAGDVKASTVSDWNIVDSATVVIPNAAGLLNINPDYIRAYGLARVGGDGSVAAEQSLFGTLVVRAPLEFEITPDARIITEPELVLEKLLEEAVSDKVEEIMVFVRYDNQLEFGTALTVLMSRDSLSFDAGTAEVLIDSLVLHPAQSGLDSLVLDDGRFDLFNQDSMYVQARMRILGRTDENGQPLPSRFMSTDSLHLTLYGRIQYLMDGPRIAGAGD